ncbi:MAG: stage III sporulation protein AF [Halanaerobiales bacterium]
MSGLIQWVKNLIFIILFTSLLEMFLPESNMRKYVRVVMGFFIITVLISPFMSIFYQDFSAIQDVIPERMIDSNWEEIQARGQEIEESNQHLLVGYYEKKVAERVEEVINLNYNDYEQEIQVKLDDNYRIEHLGIILLEKGINDVRIENVNINAGVQSNSSHPPGIERSSEKNGGDQGNFQNQSQQNQLEQSQSQQHQLKQNLKYKLSQVFQIPVENIEVIIKKGG